MADDDQIEVKIAEPELPLDDTVKVVTKPETEDAAAALKEQFTKLEADKKASVERENAARQREHAAIAEAQRARQEAAQAKAQVADGQLDTVSSGLEAAQTEATAAEAAYTAAMEAGNFADAAKAQRRMAAAEYKMGRYQEAKHDLEARKAAEPTRDAPIEADQVRQPIDHIENFISGPLDAQGTRRTMASQQWLRDHRDFLNQPDNISLLSAAHWDATAKHKLKADTSEYFEHIETYTGLRQPEATNGTGKPVAATPKPRRQSVPAAPVHNSGGGMSGGDNVVTLTRGEANAATDGTLVWNYDDPSPQKRFRKGDVLGVEEMARRKRDGMKRGDYDRTYVEQ